jgi:hypothetical protein
MPRTREQLARAAAEAEAWLGSLDPATSKAEDTTDLRRVGLAVQAVAKAEEDLAEAVATAKANGRSWGQLAMVLGVSKQAAAERFRSVGAPTKEPPVASGPSRRRPRTRPTAALRGESQAEIREWARAQGYSVGDRGRIPGEVRTAHEAALSKGRRTG